MNKEKIISIMREDKTLQEILPPILRFYNNDSSYCEKCGLPWNWCKSKVVMHSEDRGTFATCEFCWNNSTLEELKMYYTKGYKKQEESLIGTEYKMDHTLEHLLECIEIEYNKTHKNK